MNRRFLIDSLSWPTADDRKLRVVSHASKTCALLGKRVTRVTAIIGVEKLQKVTRKPLTIYIVSKLIIYPPVAE